MAGPVNLTAFHHEEEAVFAVLFLHEEVDGCTCDVLQREVVLSAVKGIRNRTTVHLACLLCLEENHLVRLLRLLLVVLVTTCNGETVGLRLFVKVGTAIGIVWADEIGCGKEVNIGLRQLFANFITFVATADVCVERCRSGMVDADTRGDADSSISLLCPFRNACNGCCQVLQYTQRTILRLVASGKSRTSGSRVGYTIGGTLRIDEPNIWETGKA